MDKIAFEHKMKSYIRSDGRSQASMARKLGIGADTFNKWVRGVNRIPDDVIAQFCETLSLSAESQVELLTLAGYTVPAKEFVKSSAAATILFASQVAPDGKALDAGTEFSAEITDLYAVFPPSAPLPGTNINVASPDRNAYYAFLKMRTDTSVSRVGWRWYYQGAVINEFEMDVRPGSVLWLQKFGYESNGIFNSPPFGRGQYRIVLLLGGNPSISAALTIE